MRWSEFSVSGASDDRGRFNESVCGIFRKNMENVYGEVLKKHLEIGMLEQKGEQDISSRKGIHVSNGVMADFLL